MGRIRKAAGERHEATISPFIADFIQESTALPLQHLPAHLDTFPHGWPFPRGDLYHWIPTLNRFDRVLELFNAEYGLSRLPQTEPFGLRLLLVGDNEPQATQDVTEDSLAKDGYSPEGDRQLVESILGFTRILLDNCGNRSLYASSSHLNSLLNSTSLSLLKSTLRLSLRLAQRYHTSRLRMTSTHNLNALLAGHFSISLDRLQKLATVFPKSTAALSGLLSTPTKSKDKSSDLAAKGTVSSSDLNAIVKGSQVPESLREELSKVQITYDETPAPQDETAQHNSEDAHWYLAPPATPSTVRRPSGLRQERTSSHDETTEPPTREAVAPSSGSKTLHLSRSQVSGSPSWALMRDNLTGTPVDKLYDLLHRIRIASAFSGPKSAVDDIVAVRLLSIANLAYVYGDTTFHQKIGQPDSEEPPQYQLAQQLTDLLQPPADERQHVTREMAIVALNTLEALSKCKSKLSDVTHALNTGVSHGILFYVLRKVVASLDAGNSEPEENEWRESVFILVISLSQSSAGPRVGDSMVSAGLIGILVDILKLRNSEAEQHYPNVLNFFDTFVHNGVRDAFQALVSAHGLDVIADLTAHEVQSSLEAALKHEGLAEKFKTKITDYQIPFFQQQTLRLLFKFIAHMFQHNTGAQDRLLRNLIDSPQLLGALKTVIANASTYGSNVWSGAVNIVTSFIHSEPTSYNVIAEAGLSKGLLEAITQTPIDDAASDAAHVSSGLEDAMASASQWTPSKKPTALGILPVGETMRDIPTAFGAICLNESGLKMFQASNALESYFDIFLSPEHVKAVEEDPEAAVHIGGSFDELARHHPPLKDYIAAAVLKMTRKVAMQCQYRAQVDGVGVKLWSSGSDGDLVAGGQKTLRGVSVDELERAQAAGSADFFSITENNVQGWNLTASSGNPPISESSIEDDSLVDGRTSGRSTSDSISVACKFLQGFLHNSSMSTIFCTHGGAEVVLDMITSPCNPYNFHELSTFDEVSRVLQLLVEHKPHLVLPSLVKRTQDALFCLKPLIDYKRDTAYFRSFTALGDDTASPGTPGGVIENNGTYTVKALAAIQTLCNVLGEVFSMHHFQTHRGITNTYIASVNLTDVYVSLVDSLGKLHTACIWEEILISNAMPKDWNRPTRFRGMGFDNQEANNVMGLVMAGSDESEARPDGDNEASGTASSAPGSATVGSKSRGRAFKNTQTLRYLLGQIPLGISTFFQSLGKALLNKPRDVYQRQNAATVADHLAQALIVQLKSPVPETAVRPNDRLAFEIVVLSSTLQILIERKNSRAGLTSEVLTLVLQKFMQQGGFALLQRLLEGYCEQLNARGNDAAESPISDDLRYLLTSATGLILDFYTKVTQSKNIHEAQQSGSLIHTEAGSRDPKRANYFHPSQFVVEIRNAVLPAVSKIWESDVAELLGTDSIRSLIYILRLTLEGDGEHNALRRSQGEMKRVAAQVIQWTPKMDVIATFVSSSVSSDLATEALFRCSDTADSAREYCALRQKPLIQIPRFPVPQDAITKPVGSGPRPTSRSAARVEPTPAGSLARMPSVEMQDATDPTSGGLESEDAMSDVEDDLGSHRNELPADMLAGGLPEMIRQVAGDNDDLANALSSITTMPTHQRVQIDPGEVQTQELYVTVDDLDDKRKALRQELIDRCLDVLNKHTDIVFDLSELIVAAVNKQPDSNALKSNIGETLVNALMSLRPEEGGEVEGKKIASYAHLLALVMQERDFFEATLDNLKEYFEYFAAFLKISPDKSAEDDAPWISTVLLIIERVLAEDEQPQQIQWTPPLPDQPLQDQKPAELKPPIVPLEEKQALFEAVVEILPKVGKDESLALSLVRTLVILTRNRQFAKQLGERRNIGRLFVMIKQLAGISSERLQSAFLITLRHIVEDEETIRQIMRTEIQSAFENSRSSRPMDTTAYTRNLYHLVLRNPEIFVEVTNEKVQLTRWDSNQRPQPLMLKKEDKEAKHSETAQESSPGEQPAKLETTPPLERIKTGDVKPPTVENPDGVVQFLLKELSSYKDVEDKEQLAAPTSLTLEHSAASSDVDMIDSTPTPGADQSSSSTPQVKPYTKAEFKVDQHPIFVYRCFLLQCLVELLSSYNRTKIEFINFSRKAEHQSLTPSKPRSALLNYLLSSLIPVGTLNHADDINHRKKLTTSNWAISAVVALCSKTSERVTTSDTAAALQNSEEESDLVYVRKFVLEHALRVYKDAMVSSEPLDQRYSRLLSLSDLFNRMLTAKPSSGNNSFSMDMLIASQKQLGRLMYEKNFITTLTASIADIDLNFPSSKRAVKYILRPLKWLTDIAVTLSTTGSDTSIAGATDEDDISSATSVSEEEDEREETPDLFRNSTLGQFEPGREDEDDESDSDEEEDEDDYYGDEYDEEMEYEEEGHDHGHGDVVSDEDDDIDIDGMGEIEGRPGDMGMDLELVMDGGEDDSDDDDDDMDDDDDDDGQDIEILDEVTGDDENASMDEGDEGDWEDDAGEEHDLDDEGAGPDMSHGAALEHIARILEGDDRSEINEHIHSGGPALEIDMGNDYFDGEQIPGQDDEEDEEDYDDEDVVYEPELEEDDDELDDGLGWGFDEPPPGILRHHQPHHRLPHDPWRVDVGNTDDRYAPPYRSHRAGATSRGNDDGTNPLLQRHGSAPGAARSREGLADWMFPEGSRSLGRLTGARGDFVGDLIQMVGPQGARINIVDSAGGAGAFPGGMTPFVIAAGAGRFQLPIMRPAGGFGRLTPGALGPMADAIRSNFNRAPISDPSQAVSFIPTLSVSRWQDEARILFGTSYLEKSLKVINSILKLLVPPAMEAKRLRDKTEAERKAAVEEQRKKEEDERVEREAQEKREKEEREAREAEEAAALAREQSERGVSDANADDSQMEGVEETQAEPAEGAASTPAQRITTRIRGRDLDITTLGIDAEYLEALPEDMREEVIMQQFADQRSQAAQAGEQPSEISREFLEALPPDIQQELLRSEAADRRRREREENRRRAAQSGAAAQPAQPEEMNNADFMAMLDPALRQSVLMEADANMLAALPAELQAEARALLGDQRLNQFTQTLGRARRQQEQRGEQPVAEPEPDRTRRPVVQMLDKSGVATLLRLMFVSMQGSARMTMHGILSDICKNAQNRAEVISILLSILQDGSADGNALERSFAQLTVRAKQMAGQKTPQPKRTLTGPGMSPPTTEMSPLMIVQQCLGTLTSLAHDNPRVSSFFLSEHETINSQRAKTPKKGKGKENRASKFPLNALLALLDRKNIVENAAVVEHLTTLLVQVTAPLKILLRRALQAEKDKAESRTNTSASAETPAAANVPMSEVSQPGASAAEATEETTMEKKKKSRDLTPPDIPEENLRLVINILSARECGGKTFSSTLDIIGYLSAIEGARDIFGNELVKRAQELAGEVLTDLEQLSSQIKNAESSTDVQGLALANFPPTGSHQGKLLRVLTALDYLFDPKKSQDRHAHASALPQKAKEGLLTTLYDSKTFNKLWATLSDCLTAVRQHGNMTNVPTILQPLVESFMVVCKNTTVKGVSIGASQELGNSPPPESRMEKFFFTFTEEHRKILNDLVRQNPKLMNGTFDVLVKNSKVLEFDNKRNYFNKRLHLRTTEERIPHPPLQLNIRRDQIFLDSFKALYFKKPNEIKYGKLNIRFSNEEGVDAGGVTREWFASLSRQMFDPNYALFNPVASDRTTFHPNPLSEVNEQHLTFFKFIGRIIGKALYEGRVLDCHFSRAVYKRILAKPVSLKDMETLDLDYYKSLCWILENDITDVTFETFSVDVDRFGEAQTIDLIPNGRNIPVTEENKQEYVRAVVEQRLTKSVEAQLENFLLGFREIVPSELISIFNEQELELLISGLPDIDVEDWKNNTDYHNYTAASPQIQWFWRAVRSFDKEEKAKLLQFVTGTSKVPLNGFKELEGMNGFSKFNIHKDYASKERLPSSHTCFNQLDLPAYDSYEALRQQMYTAITVGSGYFGFA